jgi:chaperone BCS1
MSDIISDEKLKNLFSELGPNPIIVFEDMDVLYTQREKSETTKVTQSTLFNCLDGAFYKEGAIMIYTTNHPEKLDDALKRKGRADMHEEFKNPKIDQVEEYLSKFYEEEIILDGYDKDMCMSSVQEICINNMDNKEKAIELLCTK